MLHALRKIADLVRPREPERCVACSLPIERGSPAYPYARGGRVHEDCAYGRFQRRETRDSPVPFDVDEGNGG